MTTEKLRKYIDECKLVIQSGNVVQAQELGKKIISELGTDTYLNRTVSRYLINDSDESLRMLSDMKMHLESLLDNSLTTNRYDLVYICHTEKDEDFARCTIDLLINIGVDEDKVISSSIENYTVPMNCKGDRYEYIRAVLESNALVLFLLTNHTYIDPVCMMDMGAVWILKNDYYSIISPDFDSVPKGAIDPRSRAVDMTRNLPKIKASLRELRQIIESAFHTQKMSDMRWEEKRDNFIAEIKATYVKSGKKNDLVADAEKVLDVLGDKSFFTVTAVTKMGYTPTRSKEILDYLTKTGRVKRETVGRYSWLK